MHRLFSYLALLLCTSTLASAFPVQHSVLFSSNPLKTASGGALISGSFTVKVGVFNYASNAALQADLDGGNIAGLNSNFQALYTYDGSQPPLDELDPTTGTWGQLLGGSQFVTQHVADSTFFVGNSTFNNKLIYVWAQSAASPQEMAVFLSGSNVFFNPGNDEFGATTAVTVTPGNPSFGSMRFGTDNTASTGEYRLKTSATSSVLAFTSGTASVSEAAGAVSLVVTRSGKVDNTVTANFTTADSSAVQPTDYTLTTGMLSFGPNVTSGTISVPIIDRPLFQGDRNFAVSLLGTGTLGELGTPAAVAVTILDDELPQRGTLSFSSATYSISETGTSVDVIVNRVSGSDGLVSVNFATQNMSATSGTDYTGVASQNLSWPNGDAVAKTITIPITDDLIFEGDETFRGVLTSATGGAVIGTGTTTVTIVEDDPVPTQGTISLSSATYSIAEDGGSVTITATRAAGNGGAVGISFATSNGTATSGSNYSATSGTLGWADGVSGSKTFDVTILDNVNDEADKDFTVTLSTPTGGASLVAPSSATVTINDDDTAGTLSFDPISYSIDETGGSVDLVVTRTGGSDGAISASANTGGGSAQSGDYGNLTNAPVNFANGQTSGTINVTINNNATFTGDRTFEVTLSSPTNGATLGADVAEVTILEDETPNYGVFAFSAAKFTASEVGPVATVSVSRTGGSDSAVDLTFQTADGTATAPGDYTATSGTITFAQGVTSMDITIPLTSDVDPEKKETFTVSLAIAGSSPGGTLGALSTTSVEINDDDAPATIQFAVASVTGTEGQTFSLSVVRSNLLERSASVRWTLQNGTAVLGKDFRGPQTGTLKFEVGETQKSFDVRTLNDITPEEQEAFTAVLSKVDPKTAKVKIGTPSTMKIKLVKNDNIEQPDLAAAVRGGSYVGEEVFNNSGSGQIAIQTVRTGATARFSIKVENGGNLDDTFTITALEGGLATGTSISYSSNGVDITKKLVELGGIKFRDLEPGEDRIIEVTIKAEGAVLGGYGTTITAISQNTPAKVDAARALVVISEL